MPYITYVLETIHSAMETGIEHMIHGYHISKISLVIGDKKHSLIGQGADNL